MMQAPHTIRLEPVDIIDPIPAPAELPPTMMLIDDSPTVRAVVEATFQRIGVHITAFKDGLSALGAMVRGDVDIPQLILIDIGLPKMDGYEIARILRGKEELKDTLLVMLSAHDGPLNKMRARLAGTNGFIAKPFRTDYLVDTVLAYLNRGPVM